MSEDLPEGILNGCMAMIRALDALVILDPKFRLPDKEINVVTSLEDVVHLVCGNEEARRIAEVLHRACVAASGEPPTLRMFDVVLTHEEFEGAIERLPLTKFLSDTRQ